jgi:general secretion pathway protein F
VPELIRIFATSKVELPLLTRLLIAGSDFLGSYGLYLLLALIAAFVGFRLSLRREAVRRRWHRLLLRLPVAGELVRSLETARYCSTLSILVGSGVPLLQALSIASEVLDNRVLRDASEVARQRVEEGGSLHRALDDTGVFPPIAVHLIASGEASGELEAMLMRAAVNQERDSEMTLASLMSIFEPLLVVLMGGFVLLVVLAVLMPIFNLNTLVST